MGDSSLDLTVAAIACAVIGICITIAPLIIWRNGNRTNRLLAAVLINNDMMADQVRRIWAGHAETALSFKGLFCDIKTKKCPNYDGDSSKDAGVCKYCNADQPELVQLRESDVVGE